METLIVEKLMQGYSRELRPGTAERKAVCINMTIVLAILTEVVS